MGHGCPGTRSSFFFALLSLNRFAVSLGLLDRPLFAGLIMALLTGDFLLSFGLAIFFELIWLDLFPAGTYIHPNGLASVFLAVFLCQAFSLETPQTVVLPLILGAIAGPLSAKLEAFQRLRSDNAFTRLIKWARRRHSLDAAAPGHLILLSISALFLGNFIFLLLMELAGIYIIRFLRLLFESADLPPYMIIPGLEWGHIWLAGLIGPVLAIRFKAGYIALALSALLTSIFFLS